MKRKGVLSLGITCLVGVALAGCSFGTGSADTQQETTAVEGETTIAQAETTSENKTTVSKEEAIEAGKKIFEEQLEMVKRDDYDAFLKTHGDINELTEEQKQSAESGFKFLKEYIADNYPNTEYFIAADDGRNFGFSFVNYIVAGKYPDADSQKNNVLLPITYDGENWRLSEEDEVDQLEKELIKKFPEEAIAAYDAGRNGADMSNGSDYSWMDSSVTIEDTLDVSTYVIWQNEDGSIGLLVNIKNGTNEARSIRSIDVTATDDKLGEIFKSYFDCGIIPAKTSKNFMFKVAPEDVKTGTQQWGHVNCHTHNESK